jgi:hypothetical protein
VKLDLQADCFAGVGGPVSPESFTDGPSAHRVHGFPRRLRAATCVSSLLLRRRARDFVPGSATVEHVCDPQDQDDARPSQS